MLTSRKRRRKPINTIKRKTIYQRHGKRIEIAGIDLRNLTGTVLQKAGHCIHPAKSKENIAAIQGLTAYIVAILKYSEINYKHFDHLRRGIKLIIEHANTIMTDESWGASDIVIKELRESIEALQKEYDVIDASSKLLEI